MAKVLKKRFMLLILSLFLYTPCVYSQYYDESDRTFFAGLVGGANFAQVDGDNFAGYNNGGWNAGVVIYAKIFDPIYFSMELVYAQKGSRASQGQLPRYANDKSTVLTDYRIKLNYLEIPLLVNYFDKKRNNFGLGLSYSQLVASKELYKDGFGNSYEQDAKLYPFKKYDLNFLVNANVHIWKGLFFNARFQYSMLTIRSQYNYLTGRPEQYNNLWCTRLMYIF